MTNFTSNTYTLKRKILTFANKISRYLFKPDKKFSADITYGMLAAKSCLLTDVVDQLHEASKKLILLIGCQDIWNKALRTKQKFPVFSKSRSGFLKSRSSILTTHKWVKATELRNPRKGKVKTSMFYKGKDHEAYLSHVKVQITASRKDSYLVLIYGITEHPMMLATSKEIKRRCNPGSKNLLFPLGNRGLCSL